MEDLSPQTLSEMVTPLSLEEIFDDGSLNNREFVGFDSEEEVDDYDQAEAAHPAGIKRPPSINCCADRLRFSEPLKRLPNMGRPYDFFRLLLEDDILHIIAEETNIFAADSGHLDLGLTMEELLVFIGLTLHTGLFDLNSLRDYWSPPDVDFITYIPCFQRTMSARRYTQILKALHFCEDAPENFLIGRVDKVWSLVEYFNRKMEEVGKEMRFANQHGLLYRFDVKIKHPTGLKLHELRDTSGFVSKLILTTPKEKQAVPKQPHQFCTKDGIRVKTWDKCKDALLMSIPQDAKIFQIHYRQFKESKERIEKLMAYYPISIPSLKWYKKIAFHIFHLLLTNSFIIYNNSVVGKKRLREFRLDMIRDLLKEQRPNSVISLNCDVIHFLMSTDWWLKCQYCITNGKIAWTNIVCDGCSNNTRQVGLCYNCFPIFHSDLNIP